MSAKRVFFGMLAMLLLLAGLSGFVVIAGRKLIISEGSKLTELKLEEEVLSRRSTALTQAEKDIASYEEIEQIAKSVVPQDKDQARTAVEIVQMAEDSNITISSIAFPNSLLGQVSKGKKTGTTDPNLTQLTPLSSPKGVYSMEIRVESDRSRPVPYDQLLQFLRKLENNRRTAQVTNISITPDAENRDIVTFTLTLTSYIKP